MPALKGWHRGERAIQEKLGYRAAMAMAFAAIDGDMPEQHREFYVTKLPFVPVTTLDGLGRPWGSILAGANGEPGFIQSPSDVKLVLDTRVWEGDPLLQNSDLFGKKDKMLVAGIGVEFSTRRRNKFAGWISKLEKKGQQIQLQLDVNEAIGYVASPRIQSHFKPNNAIRRRNCPKYINVRDLVPHPQASPKIIHRELRLSPSGRLPDETIKFILDADTVFIGTSYVAPKEDESSYPSHVGMNQRGGRRGYIRVKPSDGRTVVLPDYSGEFTHDNPVHGWNFIVTPGNRLMTSLGNIEVTPLASLTFVSFTRGDILYLTGEAQTLVGPAAHKVMPLHNALTTVRTTGYIFVADALPVRQRLGTTVVPSPYSPPVRLLAEEASSTSYFQGNEKDVTATLQSIKILSPREEEYHHMASGKPSSVNDDRIRTWTISSPSPDSPARAFELTMREKPGGAVTGALFSVARKLADYRPELLTDLSPLAIGVKLLGITGDFTSPEEPRRSLLWIAGGIGITPFLSMLASTKPTSAPSSITFVISTREPDVLLRLVSSTLGANNSHIRITIHIFSTVSATESLDMPSVTIYNHSGRVGSSLFSRIGPALIDQIIYMCGPPSFETDILATLVDVGVDAKTAHRPPRQVIHVHSRCRPAAVLEVWVLFLWNPHGPTVHGIPPSWLDKRPKLPSRNWLIFYTVTSSIAGLYIYDRQQCKRIRKEYVERVQYLAEEPINPVDLARKVTVYGPNGLGTRITTWVSNTSEDLSRRDEGLDRGLQKVDQEEELAHLLENDVAAASTCPKIRNIFQYTRCIECAANYNTSASSSPPRTLHRLHWHRPSSAHDLDFFNQRRYVKSGAEAAYRLVKQVTRPIDVPDAVVQPLFADITKEDEGISHGDLDFDKKVESYYKSSTSSIPSDIKKARKKYYDALPAKLAVARALARNERELTKEEVDNPPPTEVELRAERLKKELRWQKDLAGWDIVKPASKVAWDERLRDALRVFIDPPVDEVDIGVSTS
ncbi:PNPOx domain-containing protein [Salix suchowensis]|nr:PNPOx domain-containing protein [Salix suchowensis]